MLLRIEQFLALRRCAACGSACQGTRTTKARPSRMAETPGKNNPRAQHASQPTGKSNNPRHSQPVGANNPRNSQPLGKATQQPPPFPAGGVEQPPPFAARRLEQPAALPAASQAACPRGNGGRRRAGAAAHGRAQPLFPRGHAATTTRRIDAARSARAFCWACWPLCSWACSAPPGPLGPISPVSSRR